jgi:hypothetical protein
MKKLLKVLNKDLKSPFKEFQYEIGKEYYCKDFDTSDEKCSKGFYATDFNGVSYTYGKNNIIHEVEVWGKEKEFDPFKRRYENIKIGRELSIEEIKNGLLKANEKEGYNVYESVFPVNPFKVEPSITVEEAVVLLNLWRKVWDSVGGSVRSSVLSSVRDSVGGSVRSSVWDSVRDSVGGSVRSSVWDSVRDSVGGSVLSSVWGSVWGSVRGYYSSLFPIRKWKYIDHEEGVSPFKSAIDLWRAGYVASFDGRKWRLHTKDGIVWEEV